jgi:hypothetical protein
MSIWKPERWEDNLYVSAPVWMQARHDDNLPADGLIWGFPQDIPGVIVQFDHTDKYHVRFFVTFEELERTWSLRSKTYMIENVKLVELVEKREYYRDDRKVRPYGWVVLKVNNRREPIPLWTSYR